ncbi:unnamed protein product [Effrenium voratum]|uniref:Uncharacterized protein n=1 Tax=Effrenium voratum TaxID=2562239 RepID=A0AA36JJ81_9DINO|nr:unnamed protein product [Effrenium voratum]
MPGRTPSAPSTVRAISGISGISPGAGASVRSILSQAHLSGVRKVGSSGLRNRSSGGPCFAASWTPGGKGNTGRGGASGFRTQRARSVERERPRTESVPYSQKKWIRSDGREVDVHSQIMGLQSAHDLIDLAGEFVNEFAVFHACGPQGEERDDQGKT